MTSFELEIDEQSRIGAEFISRVANEIKRALAEERASRKVTQQSIANKIGTSRAVVNREVQGLENLSARRIAELLWAIGWEPYFEARKIPAGLNDVPPPLTPGHPTVKPAQPQTTLSLKGPIYVSQGSASGSVTR